MSDNGSKQMLRVAVPNKGALAEKSAEMLAEAGYRGRHEARDLTVLDPANDVEFFALGQLEVTPKVLQTLQSGAGVAGPYGYMIDLGEGTAN